MQNLSKTKFIRLPLVLTAAASVAVAFFLVLATVRLNSLSRKSTDAAADSVSRLYLRELAGRREQVVSSNLERYFDNMEAALSVIEERDLAGTESLRAYLQKIKTLFGVDMFVLVDEALTMYRAHSTELLPEHYFFAGHLTEKYIYTFNTDDGTGRKQVVLAMPVEGLSFGGRRITASYTVRSEASRSGGAGISFISSRLTVLRRLAPRSRSRHTLTAMAVSHVFALERPSKRP